MSIEKAREYIELLCTKDKIIEMMLRFYTMIFDEAIPSSAWMEILMGLDFTYLEDKIVEEMDSLFTDKELDELIEYAKSPVFKKFLDLQNEISVRMHEHGAEWGKLVKDDFEKRAVAVFPKYITDKQMLEDLLKAFKEMPN